MNRTESEKRWDLRFMEQASLVSYWSKDPSSKVGAVIVDEKNRVVSQGFNGPPRGVEDSTHVERDARLRRTIHAEMNAILFSRKDLTGTTLYCTHTPCSNCAAVIIQAGISRVVTLPSTPDFARRWESDIREARTMFQQAGVQLEVFHG